MKALTQILLLVLIAFAGKSQQREFIIEDIFPTETSTAIHAHFEFPFKMSFKIEKKKFPINYRRSYIYHFIPRLKKYKNNEMQMYNEHADYSDSTIVNSLLSDDYAKVKNYDNLFYDDRDLVTFKSGVFLNRKYNFILKVKHNQKKENFDINKLLWFVEIANSWELTHGNHH
jgi:hypothetical protein